MSEETSDKFTVKFGRSARTIDYQDSQGRITFTFEPPSLYGGVLLLETGGAKQRESVGARRFDLAVERTKRFLESRGSSSLVEIYDPAKHGCFNLEALIADHQRAGHHVEMLPDGFIVTKKPRGGFLSRISSFFKR